jgi:hypothetical protein
MFVAQYLELFPLGISSYVDMKGIDRPASIFTQKRTLRHKENKISFSGYLMPLTSAVQIYRLSLYGLPYFKDGFWISK